MNDRNEFLKNIFNALGGEEKGWNFDEFKTDMSDKQVAKRAYDMLSDSVYYGESALDQDKLSFDNFYQAADLNAWYGSADEETRAKFLEQSDIDPSAASVFENFDFYNNKFDVETLRSEKPEEWLSYISPETDPSTDMADMYLSAYDPNIEGDVKWDVEALKDFNTPLDFAKQEAANKPLSYEMTNSGSKVYTETRESVENEHLARLFSSISPAEKVGLQSIDGIKTSVLEADKLQTSLGLSNVANQGSEMNKEYQMEVEERVNRFRASEKFKNFEKEARAKIGTVVARTSTERMQGGGSRRVEHTYSEEDFQRDAKAFVAQNIQQEISSLNNKFTKQWMESNGGAQLTKEQLTEVGDYYYNNWGLMLDLDGDNKYNKQNFVKDIVESFELGVNNYFMNPLAYAFSGFDEDERRYQTYYQEVKRARLTAFEQNMSTALGDGNFEDFFRQAANMMAESAPLMLAASVPGGAGMVGLGVASAGMGISEFMGVKTTDEELIAQGKEPVFDSDTDRFIHSVNTAGSEFAFGLGGRVIQFGASKTLGGTGGRIFSYSDDLRMGTSATRAAISQAGGFASAEGRALVKNYAVNRAKLLGINMNLEGLEEVTTEVLSSVGDSMLGVDNAFEDLADRIIEAYVGGATLGAGFDAMGSVRNNARVNAQSRVDIVTGTSETMVQLNHINQKLKDASPDEVAGLQKQKKLLESRRAEELDARADWWIALSYADKKDHERLQKLNGQYVQQMQIAANEELDPADRETASKKAADLLEKASAIQTKHADISTELTPEQNQEVAISSISSRRTRLAVTEATLTETLQQQEAAGDAAAMARTQEMINETKEKAQKLSEAQNKIETLTMEFDSTKSEESWNKLLDARLEAAELMGTKTDVVHGKYQTTDYTTALEMSGEAEVRMSQAIDKGLVKEATPEEYVEAMDGAFSVAEQKDDKKFLQVSRVSVEEARDIVENGGKLFVSKDGKAGAYVKAGGYMGGLFKSPDSKLKGLSKPLQEARAAAGGQYFDAYGTELEAIYVKNGYKPVARIKFNPEFAPEGWDAENSPLKDQPDVVFFVKGDGQVGDGAFVEEWDQAEGLVQDALKAQPQVAAEPVARAVDPSAEGLTGGVDGQYVDLVVGEEVADFTEEQLPDLSSEERSFLNTVVKALSRGNQVRVHLSKESGSMVGKDTGGKAIIGKGIHIMPDQILANMSQEAEGGLRKTKTFQETVLEEVGHMLTTEAIAAMPAQERSVIASEMERMVGDGYLTSRALDKVKSYSGLDLSSANTIADVQGLIEASNLTEEQKESESARLHDEYIQEMGAGVAMNSALRLKIKLGNFFSKLLKPFGAKVSNATALKILDGFVDLKKGKSFTISELQADRKANSDVQSGRASRGISPARLPENESFTVEYYQSYIDRFGGETESRFNTRTFKGKWDFVNWWNYATLKGTGPRIIANAKLLNQDGTKTAVDVDSMMKWKLKKPLNVFEKRAQAQEAENHRARRRNAASESAKELGKLLNPDATVITYYDGLEIALSMLNVPKFPNTREGSERRSDYFSNRSTKEYDAMIVAMDHLAATLRGEVSRDSALIDVAAAKKNGRLSEEDSVKLMEAARKFGADIHDIEGMSEEEFTEMKNIQLCGLGNPKGCGLSTRISNQEYKRILAANTFGITRLDENAPEAFLHEAVDRHSDFYVEDLLIAIDFVRKNSEHDPLNFYADTRRAANDFIEDIRSNLSRTGSVSAKAAADIKGLEDLFMMILGITSNRNSAEPNVELATSIFYESILNYNLNSPTNFVSPSIIKALKDDASSRHAEFDKLVSPSNPMGVTNMGKMLENLNRVIAENMTPEGKIDVQSIIDTFMEIDPATGRQRIEKIIGHDAPKIGTFITNLIDVDRSGQYVTQDLHVGDYMSASVGDEVRSYEDKIMHYTSPVRKGTKRSAVIEKAGIKKSDSAEVRMAKLSALKLADITVEERRSINKIYRDVFANEIGRDKESNLRRKNLRERILSLTADKLNKSGRLDRDVTPADLGQVMYAYNQLKENPMAKRRAPRRYTPYAPIIDSVVAEGSYRDLSKIDGRRFGDQRMSSIESMTQPNMMSQSVTSSQEKELERNSQLLIPFSKSNVESDTDSPLYRVRSWEEINTMSIAGKPFSFGDLTDRFVENPEVMMALRNDATSARVMAKNKTPQQGDKVGVRLNLNVKKSTGIPVQTVHDTSASGEALAYSPAVVLKDVNLFVNQGARKKIATFQENKFPMASVDGSFQTSNMSDVVAAGFDGVKAVFNPMNSPYFTDVAGRPIKGASEATVFGNVVYLRGEIEYYDANAPEIQAALAENEQERAKRIKRGPKYDKALKRYAAYMQAQGKTFDTIEDLRASYDNMPLKSVMALDKSEYVDNLVKEQTLSRASRLVTPSEKRKARKFNKRASAKFEGARAAILANPEAYITKQNLTTAKEKLEILDSADLVTLMTDDALGRLSNRNDDMSVLAGIELINRKVSEGDYESVAAIVDEMGKIGTTAGRILRHFGELNTATPQGLVKVVETAVEKAGNSLSEKQKTRLNSIAEEYMKYMAEVKSLMKKAIAGEDVEAELEGATNRLKIWERQLETFANSVIERDWGTMAKMMIQGNLLTSMSQFTNVVANMFNAALIIPRDLLALPMEKAMNFLGFGTHMKGRKLSLQAYMYGIRKFGSGFVEALDEIATGQTKDVTEWRVHRGFAPFRSMVAALKGGENIPLGKEDSRAREMFGPRSLSQRIKLFAQGTFGVPAEVMFRLLGIGDTPFRRMVEGIELYNKGLEKGLEGEALRKYIKYPPTADREAAEREGRKLTFQEETSASRAAENLVRLLENTLGSVIVRSQIPYVRTPVNIVVETLTYTSPVIGVGRIYKDLRDNDARAAAENLAKVTIGGMVKFAASQMLRNGLVSGPVDFTDDEEKNLAYAEFPPNSINISGLQRLLDGGDPSKQEDDYFVSYQKLGIPGAIIGAMAQTYNPADIDEESPVTTVLRDAFGVSALSTIAVMMEQSFLAGVNAFTELLSASGDTEDFERKLERWLDSTFRAIGSIPLPNQLAVFTKMDREYMPDMRIDKDLPLEQRLMRRFEYMVKDRTFNTDGITVRVNWMGEPIDQIPRGSAPLGGYYLFDVMKVRQGEGDPVSSEVWSLFEQTEDIANIVSTPYFADLRKLKPPYPRTKKEKKAYEDAGLNFTYLDDEEFMSQTHRMTVKQANRVMAIAGKQRYVAAEQLIGTEEYLNAGPFRRLEMLDELNQKFSGVKELSEDGSFRSHTVEIMKIMQEIYDHERSED